jgi:hypothetical protein
MSSSGKSRVASISIRKSTNCADRFWTCAENSPRKDRTAHSRFAGGIDQIGNRLGLRQIKSIVEPGTAGEFSRSRHARPEREATLQQHAQHHQPAMALQLQHVLAGVGMRRREIQQQAVVQWPALIIQKNDVSRLSWRQRLVIAGKRRSHLLQARSGNTHHTNASHPESSGDRGDGVRGIS